MTTDENFTFYRKPDLDQSAPPVPEGDHVAVKDAVMHYVSVDASGKIGWESNILKYKHRPAAHIIEVLTEKAGNAYRAFLRKKQISYVIAGKGQLDCKVAAEKLKALFGIETLMLSGGGFINWSFLQAGLVDELSLVIAPLADGGNDTVTLFERSDCLPASTPVEFVLKAVQRGAGDSICLRCSTKNKRQFDVQPDRPSRMAGNQADCPRSDL